MKRPVSALLVLALTAALLASCAKQPQETDPAENNNSTEAVTAGAETVPEETEVDEATLYDPKFEEADYDGYTFDILINGNDLEPNVDFKADELTGEALNDAIFNRDQALAEKYNIEIIATHFSDGDIIANVKKSNSAGDGAYDSVEVSLANSLTMAVSNLLTPIDSIPNIDLEKPYWNQVTLKGSSILGRNYFAYSDTNIHAFGATPCVIFNKEVHKNYNLNDIYEIVTEGKWTMDAMSEMISAVTHDLDGNGVLDRYDCWGLICNNFAVDCLISGTGYNMIVKDETDRPVLNIPSEKFIDVLTGVDKVLSLDTGAMLVDRTSTSTEAREYWTEWAITENRALFWIGNLKCVERLRNMETDFGIVPLPKLDEAQENYAIHRQANIGATTAVPLVVSDIDMIGKVIEDMAYLSYRDVMPSYVTTILEGKYFRDPESIVTLKIMRDSTYCDFGFMTAGYGIDTLTASRDIVTNGRDPVSTLQKRLKIYNKSVEKLIQQFEKISN